MKDEAKLREMNSWGQFYATGKIEDYLRYASDKMEVSELHGSVVGDDMRGKAGDSFHAGFYSSDRDYIETDSYR